MSLINKLAKYGATPLNGDYRAAGRQVGESRLLGPPGRGFGGYGGMMGDPGIFGSIFKGLKSVVGIGAGIAGSLGVPGASTLSRFLAGRQAIPGATTQPIYQLPGRLPPGPLALPGSGAPTQIGLINIRRGGLPALQDPQLPVTFHGGPPEPSMGTAGGYHLNKSDYFLKDGTFIRKNSRWVKNRRRNPGNMRALSRSLSRVKSAKKMAAVLSSVTIRDPHHHHHHRSSSKKK